MTTLVGAVLRVARVPRWVPRPSGRRRPSLAGPALSVGRDPDGLTRWQADRAGYRLAALRADHRRALLAALAEARPDARPHLRRAIAAGRPAAGVLALAALLASRSPEWAAQRLRLVDDVPGPQSRFGARIDQVDATTCGSTCALVLAAAADPLLALALTAPDGDEHGGRFGLRFDRRQRSVHAQSTRCWPAALGTSPWGLIGWLRRHGAGVGPYRVRLVDDGSPADVEAALAEVQAALDLADPVPLLVGAVLPRHYVLALSREACRDEAGWRVYEPSSGEVRVVPVAAVRQRRLAPLLGFDHLHGVLLRWR